MQYLEMKCFSYTNQNWMVQTTSKVFIKDPNVPPIKKIYVWQQKIWSWSTEIKSSWFENVDTTVALRTTATTNNLTGSSIQTAIISMAQFSPPFSTVVTTGNIMHYPLKLKDEDLSSWKMEEKGTTGKDFSIDQ